MKGTRWIFSGGMIAAIVGANAATYTFKPPTQDLWDLDHTKAYSWGLKKTLGVNEKVASAKLTFYNIYNWQKEPNILNVTLMNTPLAYGSGAAGNSSNYVITKTDNEFTGSYWETTPGAYGGWKHLMNWTDNDGPKTHNKLVYDFTNLYVYNEAGTTLLHTYTGTSQLGTLNSYLKNDGFFGIGFDPDCHYYNDKIKLEITTTQGSTSVPGPMAVIPFGVGLLAALRRRFKK
jgi:hypothetical protein